MTEVCIVGAPGVSLRYELLSRETARRALSTYELREPYANTLALRTVSLGAAVTLLNDLNWYLVRFAADAWVREPTISTGEWLSRRLATAVRDERIGPSHTGGFVRVYPVSDGELAEPTYQTRPDGTPADDSEDSDETGPVVVRVTEAEFEE